MHDNLFTPYFLIVCMSLLLDSFSYVFYHIIFYISTFYMCPSNPDIIVILHLYECNIIFIAQWKMRLHHAISFSYCNKEDIVQSKMWYLLYYIPLVLSLTLFVKTDITNIRFRKIWKIAKRLKNLEDLENFR